MKTNLKSWRWSQFVSLSGLKRITQHIDWVPGLLTSLLLYWISLDFEEPLRQIISNLSIIAGLVTLWRILVIICTADDFYEMSTSNGEFKKCIYLYNEKNLPLGHKVKMIIFNNTFGEFLTDNILKRYEFHKSCFLFQKNLSDGSSGWFFLAENEDLPVFLGTRFEDFFYADNQVKTGPLIKINLIDNNKIKTITASYIISDHIVVPDPQNILIDDNGTWIPRPDKLILKKYLITCQNNKYSTYGIFEEKETSRLYTKEINVSSVLFDDHGSIVIIAGGKEIFHHQSLRRCLDSIVIEPQPQYCLGGIVWRLKNQKLEKLYEGEIRAINNDNGYILGDNGWEYNPSISE